MSDDDNLFARWSRRKRRIAEEEREEVRAPEPETVEEEISEPETPEEEAELLRRLELPLPESMKAGDDFSIFMKAGVPEFLRKRALRVLWRSNPVLANLDGLNDYDEDFTSPELTRKIIATGYKIGRGFLREDVIPEIMQSEVQELHDEALESGPSGLEFAGMAVEPVEANEDETEKLSEDRNAEEFSFNPKRMKFSS